MFHIQVFLCYFCLKYPILKTLIPRIKAIFLCSKSKIYILLSNYLKYETILLLKIMFFDFNFGLS